MAQSKSNILFDRMRRDILMLDLAPGIPLRLPALSERYAIGLTPLRECLNRLCSDRLVVPEHNKGFRVAALSRDDLLDLERSRNAIEGAMFGHSVTHGDDKWEAAVIGTYHHLSHTPVPTAFQDQDAVRLWSRRHKAFHRALVSGSASAWMDRFASQLDDQLGRYHRFIQVGLRELTTNAPHLAARAAEIFATAMAIAPHKALYDAALARDSAAALGAFNDHTRLTISAFEELTALMPKDSAVATTLGPNAEMTR